MTTGNSSITFIVKVLQSFSRCPSIVSGGRKCAQRFPSNLEGGVAAKKRCIVPFSLNFLLYRIRNDNSCIKQEHRPLRQLLGDCIQQVLHQWWIQVSHRGEMDCNGTKCSGLTLGILDFFSNKREREASFDYTSSDL